MENCFITNNIGDMGSQVEHEQRYSKRQDARKKGKIIITIKKSPTLTVPMYVYIIKLIGESSFRYF